MNSISLHFCLLSQTPTPRFGVRVSSSCPDIFDETLCCQVKLSIPKALKTLSTRVPSISLHSIGNSYSCLAPPLFVTKAKLGLIFNSPELCEDGTGGTYFMKDTDNKSVAVFKPKNEDPLSKQNPKRTDDNLSFHFKGILPGESSQREVLAYELDNNFAGVPETRMVEVSHWIFTDENGKPGSSSGDIRKKTGSLQEFISDLQCTVDDMGSSMFSIEDVQKIAILDMLLFNCDRNGGNILVKKDSHKLVPIDHAFTLPDYQHLSDLQWFEWMTWRQAKQKPIQEVIDFINTFDINNAIQKAKALGFRSDCILTLQFTFTFLKYAINHSNLSLYDIAKLMCHRHDKASIFAKLVNSSLQDLDSTNNTNLILSNFKDNISSYFSSN